MTRREFLRQSAALTLGGTLAAGRLSGVRGMEPSRPAEAASGPLRVDSRNPRYFSDGNGKAIYLCGSHMWNNLVDMGPSDPPPRLDFQAYLDFLQRYGHNFIRLWTWENYTWDTTANRNWAKKTPHFVSPHPWARTGPGSAQDGKPKFDLTKFDDEYFKRLRTRVSAAGRRGIYVSVMLFEGWAMQRMQNAWQSHPFHPRNNVNRIDGDRNRDGKGLEVHTLANHEITAKQEAYVKKVIETVGDLDNVLYEISNENHAGSTKWQYHMIRFVKKVEAKRPKQHPVGMTFQFRGGKNATLFESPADWISPNPEGGYRDAPPASDGRKVILSDTDHLWGIGGNRAWVWKSFVRGLNPIFMDPYDGTVLANRFDPKWDPIRRSMGLTCQLAGEVDMAAMVPHNELASSKFCLADPGKEYIVYLPAGKQVTVNLAAAKSPMSAVWIDPGTGKKSQAITAAPGSHSMTAPSAGDWVLRITAKRK